MKNLKKIFLLLVFALFFQSCGSGDNSEIIYLEPVGTADILSKQYNNIQLDGVIKVPFKEELYVIVKDSVEKASEQNLTEIENNKLFILLHDNEPVTGKLYITFDKKELIFVTDEFLKPNDNYTAVLNKKLKSASGKSLNHDISFSVKTSKYKFSAHIDIPENPVEGENIDMLLKTSLKVSHIIWDLNKDSTQKEIIKDKTEVNTVYEKSGNYTISVSIIDSYGRTYTIEKNIKVYKNPAKYLMSFNDSSLNNLKKISMAEMEESEFKNRLNEISTSLLSMYSYSFDSIDEESSENLHSEILSISLTPDKLNDFKKSLIKDLIDSDKFMGIVNILETPVILYYDKIGDNLFKLHFLTDNYGVSIENFNYKGYTINFKMLPIDEIPLVHNFSVEVDNITISELLTALPKNIKAPLPLLYTEEDNVTLEFHSYVSKSNLWNNIKSEGKKIINSGKKTVHKAIHYVVHKVITKINNSSTIETIDGMLKIIEEFVNLKPISVLNGIKNIYQNVNSSLTGLYSEFSSASQKSMETLTNDLLRFISSDVTPSVKGVINNTKEQISQKAGDMDKIISTFLGYKKNFDDYVNNVLNKSFENKRISFTKSADNVYVTLKNGATAKTLSEHNLFSVSFACSKMTKGLLKFNSASKFQNVTNQLYNRLVSIKNFSDSYMEAGYYYYAKEKDTKFLAKFNSTSTEECSDDTKQTMCFGAYFSTERMKSEFTFRTKDGSYLGVEVSPYHFDQGLIKQITEEQNNVLKLFEYLSLGAEAFPELSFDLRTKINGKEVEIEGSTTPDISVLIAAEFGVNLNYHVVVGGSFETDVGVAVVVDTIGLLKSGKNLGEVMEKITKIIDNAYNSAMSIIPPANIGKLKINGKTINRFIFSEDKDFIYFLKKFGYTIHNLLISEGLEDIADNIKFRLEIGADLGVGLGAGGTGSGGLSLNGKIGLTDELEFDLTFFLKFIDTLGKYGVKTFLLTPYEIIGEFLEHNKTDEIFSNTSFNKVTHLLKDTFLEVLYAGIENGDEALKDFFETMGEHMKMSMLLDGGLSAKAEEVASGSISVTMGAKLSFNGEVVFNDIYGIWFGIFPEKAEKYKEYLVHAPYVYPELALSFPVGNAIKVGLEEGVEAFIKGAFIANVFKGKMVFKDLFKEDKLQDFFMKKFDFFEPVYYHQESFTKLPLKVKVESDKNEYSKYESVTLNCNVKTMPTSSYFSKWFINGVHLDKSEGEKIYVNNSLIGTIKYISQDKLIMEFTPGVYNITCAVKNLKGDNSFDFLKLKIYE